MHPHLEAVKRSVQARPRRWVAAGVAVVVGVGLAIAMLTWAAGDWQRYHLLGTLLTVDLPAPPTVAAAGIDGDAGTLYDMRLDDLAVIASGGPVPEGQIVDPSAMVNQSLAFIRKAPDVKDLRFQAGRKTINGAPCVLVAGTFLRNGIPARLTGAFFFTAEKHAHIICFWSDAKGAKKAARIIQSIRLES